ncbi:MAG: hypothetical protein D6696_14815 [Acidobacteria bacterium]|nr:MAG: hypothetical protein D6696_14815 [Acidobacteriota bacterium]
MWQRLRSQKGESRAGCILWSLALVIGIMVAVKVIPIKIATMELKDKMREAAQLMPRGTERDYVKYILDKAAERNLPVTRENVKVQKWPNRVVMDVEFTVVLDFFIMDYDWNVKIHVDRDIFLI